ncbi:unnamed protein product [Spodoptera exigua]|nr:unnamed protein product [Spodoptera exigua]
MAVFLACVKCIKSTPYFLLFTVINCVPFSQSYMTI